MDKNARRSEPKKVRDWANPYIYIMYRYLYIYIIWKDTLRKQEIAAVSTVKRSYVAFRVTPRRKHTAEQSGGQRGTLVFWGGLLL